MRRFDRSVLDPTRFAFVTLADLETAWVVAVQVPPGHEGPGPHVHERDQLYYVLDGEMNLLLDGTEQDVPADSLVFIAEGTPHQNRNRSSVPELHLDVLVPPPPRMQPASRPAEPGDRGPGTSYVRTVGDDYDPSHVPGFDMARVAGPQTGSHGIIVNVAKVDPSSPGTSWHIHPFDQLYWVLEGQLTIDVADQHHVVPPDHLVVLPAGVPHRNRNDGAVPERHIAFLVPPPPGEPLDLSVTWEVGAPVA